MNGSVHLFGMILMVLRLYGPFLCICAAVFAAGQIAIALGLKLGVFVPVGSFPGQTGFHARSAALLVVSALMVIAVAVLQAPRMIRGGRTPSWIWWGIVALNVTAAVTQIAAPGVGARVFWALVLLLIAVTAALIAVGCGQRRFTSP
jgi:hypothetical protein